MSLCLVDTLAEHKILSTFNFPQIFWSIALLSSFSIQWCYQVYVWSQCKWDSYFFLGSLLEVFRIFSSYIWYFKISTSSFNLSLLKIQTSQPLWVLSISRLEILFQLKKNMILIFSPLSVLSFCTILGIGPSGLGLLFCHIFHLLVLSPEWSSYIFFHQYMDFFPFTLFSYLIFFLVLEILLLRNFLFDFSFFIAVFCKRISF